MDSKGNIYPPEAVRSMYEKVASELPSAAMKAKVKELVPLDEHMAAELQRVNRATRRAWYSLWRKEMEAAKKQGRAPVYPSIPSVT